MGYEDRRKLYEGGWDVLYAELLEKTWKEKMDDWGKRPKASCPSGSERGPARSPETPSPPMMRMRDQLRLPRVLRKRKRRKRKRMRRRRKRRSKSGQIVRQEEPPIHLRN